MAKTVKKDTSNSDLPSEKLPWKIQRQYKVIFGFLLVLISIGLTVAFISWFKYGPQDQSNLNQFPNLKSESGNWAGEFGSYVSEFFIRNGFGVASFLLIKIFFLIGLYLILDLPLKKLR
jgi:S-DNA-T family DNA segregation ATPase FtsK/SpoIIIE